MDGMAGFLADPVVVGHKLGMDSYNVDESRSKDSRGSKKKLGSPMVVWTPTMAILAKGSMERTASLPTSADDAHHGGV